MQSTLPPSPPPHCHLHHLLFRQNPFRLYHLAPELDVVTRWIGLNRRTNNYSTSAQCKIPPIPTLSGGTCSSTTEECVLTSDGRAQTTRESKPVRGNRNGWGGGFVTWLLDLHFSRRLETVRNLQPQLLWCRWLTSVEDTKAGATKEVAEGGGSGRIANTIWPVGGVPLSAADGEFSTDCRTVFL